METALYALVPGALLLGMLLFARSSTPIAPTTHEGRATLIKEHNRAMLPKMREVAGSIVKVAFGVMRPRGVRIAFMNDFVLSCQGATLKCDATGISVNAAPEALEGTTMTSIAQANGHIEITFSGGFILTCCGRIDLYAPPPSRNN